MLRVFVWCDFSLHNDPVARQRRENVAELHLGGAVAARGFKMVYAELKRAADRRFEILLGVARNRVRGNVLPFVLVTHPAAGEDRHLQLGSAETAVFHAREICHGAKKSSKLKVKSSRKNPSARCQWPGI